MNDAPSHIIVAGAGLAGLSAAISFARRGYRVTIVERAANLHEIGAGIQLPSNATTILERLGLLGHLRGATDQVSAVELRSMRSGEFLLSLPVGAYSREKWGAPYLAAHRGDLHRALVSAIGYEPDIRVMLSAEVTGYARQEGGVTVAIDRDGYSQDIYGDLLVGADGVRSRVRSFVPGAADPVASGYVALRTTIPADGAYGQELAEFIDGHDRVVFFLSHRRHIVVYRVRKGRLFNIVLVVRDRALCADPRAWGAPANTRLVRKALRFAHPTLRLLRDEDIVWTSWPIYEVPENSAWTDGPRVVLIGDAAHAMLPFAAQGAAMGIEDADLLAEHVVRANGDLSNALSRFELERKARLRKVRRRTHFNGFVYHAGWPVSYARNLVFRRRPALGFLKSLGWLYGYRMPPAA
jgi:salicylate hydroxylase